MWFNIGDQVTWKSGANGTMRTKVGTIIVRVPPNISIGRMIDTHDDLVNKLNYDLSALVYGYDRPAESFLVAVSMVTATGRLKHLQKLYWPRVSYL
mgnify:FL=1